MAHLTVNLQSLDDKVKFSASARENPEIVIDYFPPVGAGEGYTSLELLMASFGSCLATTALTILRHRMRKTVESLSVNVEGTQREEHPKSLERMHVTLSLTAKDLTEAEVRQAITVAEEAICPVWAMIKGNVEVDVDVEIS
ncbi:MAG: OsmC family protein [Oscillospiraceae bacterium]